MNLNDHEDNYVNLFRTFMGGKLTKKEEEWFRDTARWYVSGVIKSLPQSERDTEWCGLPDENSRAINSEDEMI